MLSIITLYIIYIGLIILAYIVAGLKPMLCIETWSIGMGLDVWLTELSGSRYTAWLGGGGGSERLVRPWLGRRLLAYRRVWF